MADNRPAALLPTSWRPLGSHFLPDDPTVGDGPRLVRWFTLAYLGVVVWRSLVHLFAADGGAQSIATIDTAVEGGANIIGLFGQWGAIQLLLAALLVLLVLRYPGLLPLVVATLLVEPVLREVAGVLKPVETVGTAPGAALNRLVLPVLAVAFWMSLCPARADRGARPATVD